MAEKMMKVRELVISYGKDYLEVEEKTMRSPLDVANAFFPICDLLPDEHGFVLMLNAKNKMLGYEKFSHGNLTSALVHSRNVFRAAIMKNAAAIIFIHNHPSGNPDPSTDDMDLSNRLVQAGDILGIRVLDSIIIGQGCYVSLKQRGII
jgi:DNA repair protein RadC